MPILILLLDLLLDLTILIRLLALLSELPHHRGIACCCRCCPYC